MAKTYIALDLETTGLDPNRDAIIEIGALRFQGDRELETFSTFVNPGRNIPLFVTELTGITNADVRQAPALRQALQRLTRFVGHSPVVGHNISFDLAFLRRHGTLLGNPGIDTFELAGILVPHAGRYSLANLVRELGIDLPEQTHRALDDAQMAHALFEQLLERAAQLPQQTLKELVRLGQQINWGAANFFRDAQYRRRSQGFSGGIGAQLAARRGGDAAGPLFMVEDEYVPLEPNRELLPLDTEALLKLLDEGGRLIEAVDGYECRPQQQEMLQAVAQAFNQGHHLLVEAGTGTGKSLAYLLPALQWAVQNNQRVVISTNTINLQEQLADKDIPELGEALQMEFRSMVLKGRSHYLCRRQFEALRRRGPASDGEMQMLAKILVWLPNTLDGDGDALFLPTSEDRAIWYSVSAVSENCDAEHCRYFMGGDCFFYRARDRAESAHLLVVNHALLLADVATQNRVLPEYDLLVVDEGHHLERATTDAMQVSISWTIVRYMLDDLLRGRRGYPGILEHLRSAAENLPRKISTIILDTAIRLEDVAERAGHRLEETFDALEMFLDEHGDGRNKRYAVRLRVTEGLRKQPGWDTISLSWSRADEPFAALVEGLAKLRRGLEDLEPVSVPDLDQLLAPLVGITRRLTETYVQLKAFIDEPIENAIYWLEAYQDKPLSVNAAPLRVGPLIREHLFENKRSVVLTSATLQIAGTFDYLRERLEAWEAEGVAVGSPFDYESAALLYLVKDIPQPGHPGHQNTVEETLLSLFTATEGRAMALFTSYSQLQATARAITGKLASKGITVYAQGSGSSRAQLLENFRKGDRAVLLGTRSFWEGVDVPGDALSCLVIVKLPFDVPNNPIIAARSEDYDDAFNEYMVPEAVLRFLQGFGRLIRTREDVGIAVVLDSRLLTKRYGPRFLDSLPGPKTRVGMRVMLPEVARHWLAREPLPPEPASDLWSVPPPEEPPW